MATALLTKSEVAERARLHPSTLGRLIRDGRGPNLTMLGHKQLISEAEFSRWVDANTDRPMQGAA